MSSPRDEGHADENMSCPDDNGHAHETTSCPNNKVHLRKNCFTHTHRSIFLMRPFMACGHVLCAPLLLDFNSRTSPLPLAHISQSWQHERVRFDAVDHSSSSCCGHLEGQGEKEDSTYILPTEVQRQYGHVHMHAPYEENSAFCCCRDSFGAGKVDYVFPT